MKRQPQTIKRIIQALACGLLLLLATSLTACSSKQESSYARAKQSKQITWGVRPDTKLFGLTNIKTGKIEGFEIDLAHAVAKKIFNDPSKVEFTPVVAKTRGPLLDSGELDTIIATYTINDERKKQYDFSDPYFTDPVEIGRAHV